MNPTTWHIHWDKLFSPLDKRLPLLAEEGILQIRVAGKVVILSILAESAGYVFECDF